MIVRPATAADAGAIALIHNPIIRDTPITFTTRERTPEDVAGAIAAAPCFLVAEEDGRVGGFASYEQFRKGPGYAQTMEHTIILAPSLRGRGAGRTLMAALEDHARSAGAGSLWAGISAENPGGVAFHAAIGFEHAATLPSVGRKFGRWMDLVLMHKWLMRQGDAPSGSL